MADRHHVSNKIARVIASPDRRLSAVVILGMFAFMFVVIAMAAAS